MGRSVFPAVLFGAGLLGLAGCSATPALAPGQTFPVFFTNASVVPDEPAKGVVNAAANWAKTYPTEVVKVTGYADPRAAQTEAMQLSVRRADEVASLLEEQGVAPDRIRRSTGDEALIGMSGIGNRRVDIAVGL